MSAFKFSYPSMGTHWEITIWDELPQTTLDNLRDTIIARTNEFDKTYSRFKQTSLVWSLADKIGVFEVPTDFVTMLKIYFRLYELSDHKFNPLIGHTLSDMGYDWQYTLKPKDIIAPTPALPEALKIIDDTHIELLQPVLIDFGGIGKGYFVDKIADYLRQQNLKHFLVNGSSDMVYESSGETFSVGLEDPQDAKQVIGSLNLAPGAMCGSGSNRRRWDKYHHIINPLTNTSPDLISASWVLADKAVIADALASCLFLVPPENFNQAFNFEYCLMNSERKIKRSPGFKAELF